MTTLHLLFMEKIRVLKQNKLLKKYFEKATFIHKDSTESFILICKNQTCSEKLKSSEEVEEYINAKSI